ncbi:rRNA maturation RNase YbeY [Blattabacterium cuenoti]|uniref:rRNA maturation RNase YbeY n=1 Tax=Blattabacterium cuenoti TaxID=1653831 RepID=UPI00163C3F1E|nr:rRNA maturation RNase YbeY [Blattabacterium cuenoti]
MIKFFYEKINFKIKDEYSIIKKIYLLLENEKKYMGNINYIFCKNNYILFLNKKYLNNNNYTDVIAFDYSFNKHISGDIYISIDQVTINSKEWNQIFDFELLRVMIHSILHILGYKDKKTNDKIIMIKKENFYLNLFQY